MEVIKVIKIWFLQLFFLTTPVPLNQGAGYMIGRPKHDVVEHFSEAAGFRAAEPASPQVM